jgi:putative transposase
MWKGHNGEHVLRSPLDKARYLKHLSDTYTGEIRKNIHWHAFCVMGNHTHEIGRVLTGPDSENLDNGVKLLGDWMRNAHSRFGAEYNRRNNRYGKVAYDRPKTVPIDSHASMLAVMFYLDANPVRAGLVRHPSRYRHSSYRFYAYGERNELTRDLVPPDAYLSLGRTARERQRNYRRLCDEYLRLNDLLDDGPPEGYEGGGGALLPGEGAHQRQRLEEGRLASAVRA